MAREKPTRTRDEFTETTKRIMAERVAWRCSFPNCNKITIGPQKGDETKSMNLGEAAHITAASLEGPRYDKDLDRTQRRAITNGVWMCRPHARFIDTDYKEYSAATLNIWKKQAEGMAYEYLMAQGDYQPEANSTLIALGAELLFWGIWKSVDGATWTFEISSYLQGNLQKIRLYSDNLGQLNENQKFIIIESQGDARKIAAPVSIAFRDDGKIWIAVTVAEKIISSLPQKVGIDLELGDDGDLVFRNGDLTVVSGVDAAIQKLVVEAGTIYGELRSDPTMGSHISEYYRQYYENEPLLSKLIKLELIRLSLIPRLTPDGQIVSPSLSFIKEIVEIDVKSFVLEKSRLTIYLALVLGDGTKWKGHRSIFIKHD